MANWKEAERRVAKLFGSRRTPLSGGNSGHTRSDSLSGEVFVETKYRQKHAVFKLWRETDLMARKEKKITVVALREKGSPKTLFLVDAKAIIPLSEIMREAEKNEQPRKKRYNIFKQFGN